MTWTLPRTLATGDPITGETDVVGNLNANWHNVTQATGGANASITTSVLDLIDAPSATFENVLTKLVWSIGGIDATAGNALDVYLYKNGSSLVTLAVAGSGSGGEGGIGGFYLFTASAGTDTYSLRAQLGFGSATIYAPYTICLDQQG
jgi:hypothetical protein